MKKIVKLCGFREEESLNHLDGLEVNMVGFILAESKRRVSMERLGELTKAVPKGIQKVGYL